MKVLCVCDVGINRSVHVASILKHRGHDTVAIGIATASVETVDMLCAWADRIIVTEARQASALPSKHWEAKGTVWELGPDTYPRPFNRILMRKVTKLIDVRRKDLVDA